MSTEIYYQGVCEGSGGPSGTGQLLQHHALPVRQGQTPVSTSAGYRGQLRNISDCTTIFISHSMEMSLKNKFSVDIGCAFRIK